MIEIRAAQRLLVMARPIPEDLKKDLINRVKQRCRCDEATARHYLIDEEWNFEDAITSYEGDKKHGLHARKVLADDNGDAERLNQLKTQIRDLEIDVKEIEDDGDDATVERKHLESLRDEQRKLKETMGIEVKAATRLRVMAANNTAEIKWLKGLGLTPLSNEDVRDGSAYVKEPEDEVVKKLKAKFGTPKKSGKPPRYAFTIKGKGKVVLEVTRFDQCKLHFDGLF